MASVPTKTRVAIVSIFPFEKRHWLYAHLDSFDWDFPAFRPVLLHVGDETIRMHYAGFANVEGTAALQLVPADPRYPTVRDVVRILGEADASGRYRPAGVFVEPANG
ncbi:MAG: hypothetical protein HY332_16345 [Chloroflexi bacterium]|nr:hypothetical protein [Chloroflexota bacterium]